jgi:asparagine synthase (glutamine-hydrolysing)
MCGFTGFLYTNAHQWDENVLHSMAATITHRGPNDAGYWCDKDQGIGLGFRRLSIVDLSPAGHQPMFSGSGRYVIVFNGEIYNYRALRAELEGANKGNGAIGWRGHSDTEVMLACIEEWGVEASLAKFNGMFAFALWDRRERILHMARDRYGEKPLYYGWMGGTFLFGSELKALKAHPAWNGEIDRGSLALFTRYNYIPAPYSIYQGIHKLPQGQVLSLSFPHRRIYLPKPRGYWSVKETAEAGMQHPYGRTEKEAVDDLDNLLRDAVAIRMEADVPLGAFLSGGVDSSTIVALMQAQSTRSVKTFCIGFDDKRYNEAVYAKAVASHLGTDHTELYVTSEELLGVIPRLPQVYDEPFSDASQICTLLVSQLTRQHVTVALSGDGGDELFGGYNRYLWLSSIWQKFGWLPIPIRKLLVRGIVSRPPQDWDKVYSILVSALPKSSRVSQPGDSLHKIASILALSSPEEMYHRLVSHWEPMTIMPGVEEPLNALTDHQSWLVLPDITQRMMFLDQVSYLPGDNQTKVDRASMAVSLEQRAPILDHRVAEFAWHLPLDMKIRNGTGKWLLRQVLKKYVPDELINRPKMGFAVPLDSWLRGPLRDWAENCLDARRLREEGFFDPMPIRSKWEEHLAGQRNWSYPLWDILMFQAWLETSEETRALI